jgi:L-lactate utilization protein LutC
MDASILGDGRSLWHVNMDFTIKSWVDDFCLTPKGNDMTAGVSLAVAPCGSASAGKWIVFKEGDSTTFSISLVADNALGVVTKPSEKMDNAVNDASASASDSYG